MYSDNCVRGRGWMKQDNSWEIDVIRAETVDMGESDFDHTYIELVGWMSSVRERKAKDNSKVFGLRNW